MLGLALIAALAAVGTLFLVLCVRENRRQAFQRPVPQISLVAEGIQWIEAVKASHAPEAQAPNSDENRLSISAESDLLRLSRALNSAMSSEKQHSAESVSPQDLPHHTQDNPCAVDDLRAPISARIVDDSDHPKKGKHLIG